jgi:beta-galactosidase/beta-glucuronidase
MPSNYDFTYNSIDKTIHEWEEIIQRDINHPSIFVWVPFNESWGIRDIYDSIQQQNYAISVYYLTKALDPTRLVSINDGWEQLEQSDICSIHDYMVTGETFEEKYHNLISLLKTDAQGKMLYANGHKWKGQPIIISEFGGKSIGKDTEGWGYYENVLNSEDYVSYLSSLILSVKSIHEIKGYCYTQFTDVMQEKNGLLDEQRVPKIPIEKMSKINNSFN